MDHEVFNWILLLHKVGFENNLAIVAINEYIVFICPVIGTRHTYEPQIRNDGPKCENWLGIIIFQVKLHLRWIK